MTERGKKLADVLAEPGRSHRCDETNADETEARLWEISENLHRAELSVLDRSALMAEWMKLTDEVSAQLAPKLSARGRKR